MRAHRTVGIAGWVDQGATERFSGDADIEGDHFRGDGPRRAPGDASVERAVERDHVGDVIVPCYVHSAVGRHERDAADGPTRPAGIASAVDGKARPVVCGAADPDATARRSAGGRVPGDVDVVAEGPAAPVLGDHRLSGAGVWPPGEAGSGQHRVTTPAV